LTHNIYNKKMKKLIAIFLLVFSTSLVFGQANGLVISNKASGGAIGTAAATVDVASLFNVNQTTASQTLTVPNLTNTTNGKTIHINNVGSTAFTLLSKTIEPGTGILLRWTGSAWNISGVGNATGGGGGSGDIEGVTAGNGISGGGTTGTVTISADTSILATKNGLLLKVDKSGTKVLSDENYSTAEKSKLSGIATGATANSTDAQLRDRSTHTGQDQISDVSGLQSALNLKANTADLGNSATRNVGTTTGTVAAGDDSRFNVAGANTLTGTTLASNVTASSLTSVGTLATLTVTAPIVGSESTGSSTTINTNVPYNERTLTGNTTFTFSNAANDKTWIVIVKNVGTAYTVTWPTVEWGSNGAPTQRANTGTTGGDVYTFIQVNGVIHGAARQ
jgi:hypothetical protein